MWLDGIRVVDFTTLLPGPYATLRLADLGAEIIKIEPPHGGDPARYTGPKVAGMGAVFLANNRNKRSVMLDLKDEADRKKALALITDADVLMEGFRPGVMRKLGLDYDAVRTQNPDIVYCSLTGYGQAGPLAQLAGHDLNYLGLSGVLAQLRDIQGRPILPSVQFADMIGGMAASEAVLAGLIRKFRTGHSCLIDVAMTDAAAGLLTNHALMQRAFGFTQGVEELNGGNVCYHIYETKDERWVTLAALEPKFWERFCTAVGSPEWVQKQFSKAQDGEPFYEELKAVFASQSLDEWTDVGRRTDCCLQPILEVGEFLTSDYAQARQISMNVDVPSVGTVLQVDTHAGGHKAGDLRRPAASPPVK